MGRPSTTHKRAAQGTPSAFRSSPAASRHDTSPTVLPDQPWHQWHRQLRDHPEAAVRELADVILAACGTRPLLARPVIRRSGAGQAPRWYAMAVTDRFVVNVVLTITQAGTMTTYTSDVRFLEISDREPLSPDAGGSGTPRLGGADMTMPSPGIKVAAPPPDDAAGWDAVRPRQPAPRLPG